jgi:hypothetical protein
MHIKNDKKIGKDLPKSLIAISALPLTNEPTISAKAYKKFMNPNAHNKPNITIRHVMTKD